MSHANALSVHSSNFDNITTVVKTDELRKILELSKSILEGDYSHRITSDFEDSVPTKIIDNLNKFCDKVQLNPTGLSYDQDKTVATFIEVISSFTNLDFKQKLPISENGTIMDAIATGINILGEELQHTTASKQDLERERNRLNEAQAIAKIGSWELSLPSFHLDWSRETYRILEVDEGSREKLFQIYTSRVHPEDQFATELTIRSFIRRYEDFTIEHRVLCNDNSVKFILCIGEVVKGTSGKAVRWKGTIQDITAQKNIEEKLRKAKELAEDANRAKSRFLANMSHEIRTPLNGILGLTEIMMGENVTKEHLKYLSLIRDSGKNLSRLINDILDFSKIESGNMQLESIQFDFSKTITSCILPYKFLAEQKGIGLSFHFDENLPDELVGDPTRISQIITNLIGNAIKFTDHGKVEILFNLKNQVGDEVIIEGIVKDTGIGVPPGFEQKIFQSFTQADESITRKFGGTGLGLSIVKKLLQMMSGDIIIQSPADPVLNRGSAFIFTAKLKVPIGESLLKTEGVVKPKKFASGMPEILVVDDNKVNLLVANNMASKFGAAVTTAENGKSAIELVRNHHFDLILMDVQMPELNGCETTQKLRTDNFKGPIIGLSASAYQEDIQAGLDAGMDSYLHKPYTEEQLFVKLREFLD